MGIRETLNRRPAVTFGVVAGIIVVAAAFILWPSGSTFETSPGQAAYTINDGKNWFVDVGGRITPFMKDRQPAVGAALFVNENTKDVFVGYLQRHDPAAVQSLSKPDATKLADLPAGEATELSHRLQVKRLGAPAGAWVRSDSPDGAAIMKVEGTNGQRAIPFDP